MLPISALVLNSWYDEQDARFLEGLRGCTDDRALAALADRMRTDHRPWVRQQILSYLALPLDRPGHHPLVKRLFKQAEAANDAEMMGAFLAAFDRLIRRRLVERRRWDPEVNAVVADEDLVLPRECLLPQHAARHAKAVKVRHQRRRIRDGAPLFSLPTRLHLRRRAWRWFRHLGHRDPAAYRAAITPALARYRDADVQEGHDLLECWGLVNALFGRSPVLSRQGTWIDLAEGRSLSELAAAPPFATVWSEAPACEPLLNLAGAAQSRLVRTWAQDQLRAAHAKALAELPIPALRPLLASPWSDVRAFAAGLLEQNPRTAHLAISEWLELLALDDAELLPQLCALMRRHVHATRLSHADAVRLACHRAAVVCRAALEWIDELRWDSAAAQTALTGFAAVACPAMAEELGRRYLKLRLGEHSHAAEALLLCFDHRLIGMRAAGRTWVEQHQAAIDDALLWTRLAETPYDEVRAWLVRMLERHPAEASVAADQRAHLWRSVLLGIHRGGREKTSALRQLTAAVRQPGADADLLFGLMAVALRSLRRTEQAAGLAAVVQAVAAEPRLAEAAKRQLPELDLSHLAEMA